LADTGYEIGINSSAEEELKKIKEEYAIPTILT
jgi:hypothetical protein